MTGWSQEKNTSPHSVCTTLKWVFGNVQGMALSLSLPSIAVSELEGRHCGTAQETQVSNNGTGTCSICTCTHTCSYLHEWLAMSIMLIKG